VNKRILVVDDDAMNREVMEAFLSLESYDVLLASNGNQGLSLAEQTKPNLIILDVRLPDILGYEVCEILKQKADTRSIPILMVTGFDAKEDRERALQVGVDDFLSRPFDGEALIEHVNRLLSR
jgi:two-component system, cell cycle response regulator